MATKAYGADILTGSRTQLLSVTSKGDGNSLFLMPSNPKNEFLFELIIGTGEQTPFAAPQEILDNPRMANNLKLGYLKHRNDVLYHFSTIYPIVWMYDANSHKKIAEIRYENSQVNYDKAYLIEYKNLMPTVFEVYKNEVYIVMEGIDAKRQYDNRTLYKVVSKGKEYELIPNPSIGIISNDGH